MIIHRCLALLLLLCTIGLSAQPIVAERSVTVLPFFKLGETKTYRVKVESKMEDPPKVYGRSEENYLVRFTVLDTVRVYTILYQLETVDVKTKNWLLPSLTGRISNGISLLYKIDHNGRIIYYNSFQRVNLHLVKGLDSLMQAGFVLPEDTAFAKQVRQQLSTVAGVSTCMEPFIFFNSVFTSYPYRKPTDYRIAERVTLFDEPIGVPGVLQTTLEKTNLQDSTAELKSVFHGDRDSAAKAVTPVFLQTYEAVTGKKYKDYVPIESRNDSEREFKVRLSDGWPIKITDRTINYYLFRYVYKTTMELVE